MNKVFVRIGQPGERIPKAVSANMTKRVFEWFENPDSVVLTTVHDVDIFIYDTRRGTMVSTIDNKDLTLDEVEILLKWADLSVPEDKPSQELVGKLSMLSVALRLKKEATQ